MTLRQFDATSLLRSPRADPDEPIARAFAKIREEFDLPERFPEAVEQEANALLDADRAGHQEWRAAERLDARDVPFVTVDPPGSMDLDQAVHLSRDGGGIRVRYAIADVPTFVVPGGAIDSEARVRGTTMYLPDGRIPLHPPQMSEGIASLLPEQERPAFVWDITLDSTGEPTRVDLRRALVRSRARYTYAEVMEHFAAGTPPEPLALMQELGETRIESGLARGAASLPMPDQEVVRENGGYRVEFRPGLPSEEWNAQISLLTGTVAASMMTQARVGVLRTLPPASDDAVSTFRNQVRAHGHEWPVDQSYGRFLASLDRTDPQHLAIIHDATALFRGAGYVAFDGSLPEQDTHAAVAAPYAHVTAPLRRLVDRFGLVVCCAVMADASVPAWAREALPALPDIMSKAGQLASAVDRACTDAVEAAELARFVGRRLPGLIVSERSERVTVQIPDPAVIVQVPRGDSSASVADQVTVLVEGVDIVGRTVAARLV